MCPSRCRHASSHPSARARSCEKYRTGTPVAGPTPGLDLSLGAIQVVLAERAAHHQHLGPVLDGSFQDPGRAPLGNLGRADRNERAAALRLVRKINHRAPQALEEVLEDRGSLGIVEPHLVRRPEQEASVIRRHLEAMERLGDPRGQRLEPDVVPQHLQEVHRLNVPLIVLFYEGRDLAAPFGIRGDHPIGSLEGVVTEATEGQELAGRFGRRQYARRGHQSHGTVRGHGEGRAAARPLRQLLHDDVQSLGAGASGGVEALSFAVQGAAREIGKSH